MATRECAGPHRSDDYPQYKFVIEVQDEKENKYASF